MERETILVYLLRKKYQKTFGRLFDPETSALSGFVLKFVSRWLMQKFR